MKTPHTNKPKVEIYIGGCTGSNVAQAERIARELDDGSTDIVKRPVFRQVFGTHTTAIAVRVGDTGFIIDNGSGVGQVCEFLKAKGVTQIFILQTHYHLDHLLGLPVNSFLLRKDIVKGIFSPRLGTHTLESVMDQIYASPFWPVWPKKFGIQHPFQSFEPGEPLPIMGGGIKTLSLNHDGGSVGYRIPTPEGDIAIVTDNELSNDDIRLATANFIAGSAVAYIDVQYRDGEYNGEQVIGAGSTMMIRKNWGHSTPSMLVKTFELMVKAPVLTLIGHHDPKRSDEDLFAFEREVRRTIKHLGTKLRFAKECDIISVNRPRQARLYLPVFSQGAVLDKLAAKP
jgi:ribonuclease BN (tRNA processing enzyme)